jgi:hypothetical protein
VQVVVVYLPITPGVPTRPVVNLALGRDSRRVAIKPRAPIGRNRLLTWIVLGGSVPLFAPQALPDALVT